MPSRELESPRRRAMVCVRGLAVTAAAALVATLTMAAVPHDRAAIVPNPAAGTTPADMTATHAYLIASSAHTTGLHSTMWLSDVVVHNPGAASATATLFFLASGKDNAATAGTTVTVAAGASVKLADIVGVTFGQTTKASGAILVTSDDELVVTSRTFNDDAAGTYGQYIEGYPTLSAIGTGEQARLIQLTKNTEFRTNIGFANATGSSLSVTAALYHGDGTAIGSKSYTVEPWSYFQETDIIGDLTSADVDDAFAVVSSATANAKYFTYAAVTDNRTGDPIQAVPVAVTSAAPLYLLGAAHVSGYGGSNWRTDLEVHNPGTTQASYTIELLKRVTSNTSPTSKSYTLAPGTSVRYDDVLSSVFAYSGAASLRITPTQGSIAATQRTYNDQPDGTYGQFNPGLLAGSAVAYGQTGRLVQLSQSSSDDTGFRSNLGLVNATGESVTVDIALYDGDGTQLGTTTKTLGAYGYQQIDKVFTVYGGQAVADGYVVVSTATQGGSFFAYASLVDNRSGDPITVPAQVFDDDAEGDEITVMLPGDVPLTLVRIPAGTFSMGSPESERGRVSDETQHQVTLTQDYYIGKYEVTQAQWAAVIETSSPSSCGSYGVGDEFPVYCVSWNEICGGTTGSDCTSSSFIGKMNQLLGTTSYRLPTEAEWEYAARAGTTTRYSHGDVLECDDSACSSCANHAEYMWWCGNNSPDGAKPVGSKKANPWDLYDMHGNLWEWVADWQGPYPSSAVSDPNGPLSASVRVFRGGGWSYGAAYSRSARRAYDNPNGRSFSLGFRLAMSVEGQSCSFSITPTSRGHGSSSESGSISVTTPMGCAWTAASNETWITVTSGASGSGDGTVSYAVAANGTTSQRTGTITVAGETFTVTQAGSTSQDEITVMLPGGVSLTLVKIAAGTFQMGSPESERGRYSEETQHQVTLTRDYYVGKYLVTQAQWAAVMGTPMLSSCGSYGVGDEYPVYCVGWNDICGGTTGSACTASSFIGKLNAYLGTTKYRMPTEAEWEYAARAGTTTRFSHGDVLECDDSCGSCSTHEQYMWWCGNNSPDGTKPVGSTLANPWGLYDMHGNVWEFVGDWYGEYPSSAVTDPAGPSSGTYRVLRGGGWSSQARRGRSAARLFGSVDFGDPDIGFRLAGSQ